MKTGFTGAIPASGFTSTSVLVIGDLMLDRYISGDVNRISPEAPVPILSIKGERAVAGGAANVALNVRGLGARTFLAGVVGADAAGTALLDILSAQQVQSGGVIADPRRITTCKTRVVSDNHQIVRLDQERVECLPDDLASLLFEQFRWALSEGIDAVVLSDYGKGVFHSGLAQQIIDECRSKAIPVMVDPKRGDLRAYSHATCITPNEKEFHEAVSAMGISGDLLQAGRQLRERVSCGVLLVTQGSHGMTLITSEGTHHFPALAQEVFDVSGAGDTVIAVLTTILASRFDLVSAVQLANAAASIVVRRTGTSPICRQSLIQLLNSENEPVPVDSMATSLAHPLPESYLPTTTF